MNSSEPLYDGLADGDEEAEDYTVTVTLTSTGESQTVTVDAIGFRDAALTASDTPFDLWSAVR